MTRNELPPPAHDRSSLAAGAPYVVSVGADAVDRVQDLWEQMRCDYVDIDCGPVRTADESWNRRRASYVDSLLGGGGFVLGLEDEARRLIAYAAVKLIAPSPVFAWADQVAELETLVVAAGCRSRGLGARLMSAVRAEVRRRGCGELQLQVLATNERAVAFYRDLGFTDWIVTLHEVDGTDAAA